MQIISAKTRLQEVPSHWRSRRIELGVAGYLGRDEHDRVSVYVERKPTFMSWFRAPRVSYLGVLGSDVQRRVLPLLASSKRIRVRVVDVPGPYSRAGSTEYHVSIWGETDATSAAPAGRLA